MSNKVDLFRVLELSLVLLPFMYSVTSLAVLQNGRKFLITRVTLTFKQDSPPRTLLFYGVS
jgi:hypothetical protein